MNQQDSIENKGNSNSPSGARGRSPWSWIPTLYFAEGIPYVVAMTVAVIMYKRLGISNTDIALYTSWLYLPWVIKPFWSPFVDIIKTKRWWIVSMQLLIGAGLAGVAFLIPMPFFFQATLAVLWLIAFSSATHDIAADGFYMLALDSSEQSFFVGIRSTFYRLAMITGQGLLIIVAGGLETFTGLEPMQFTVQSSNTKQNEITLSPQHHAIQKSDKMTFVAFPANLTLNTNNITADSLSKIKNFALEQNRANGFIAPEKTAAEQKNNHPSWWTQNVSTPLGHFIKTHFGEKRIDAAGTDGKVGNAGLIAVQLTQKPESGKTVVLNSSLAKGDKNISIISGERIVFTEANWNKPAYMVVGLDYKLKDEVTGNFKGISGNIKLAWSITFFILAGLFILLFIYHRFILPRPTSDHSLVANSPKDVFREFGRTFATFFKKPGVGLALVFMLLYRLGEAMLVKMASPFLLDAREVGGLGLTTGQVGLVYGTVGVIALTLGGIIGGFAASRKGLKYWIWPMALSITLPHLAFLYLSWFTPESLVLINISVALEQFGYGFGFTAYMLYMIYFADGEHKTAHYAICTGFMAMGMMLPGMIAGWLQDMLGYNHFFIWVMICAIPTLAIIPFLKIDKEFGKKKTPNP
ncbi:major facilitator superfamily MFS_1 [Paludibacter propionicigenes WB4]|uniref:Major facilitator superfamily MFS_1 n=1 Tax=Paludibacter propionicigenes (strain DSM 17365 / JCM 13257 / WB4) TaxID=694427 RepID=E4T7Y7_PALPW|nr:MFS transporter [Paludibacter propionicigenes]ADQ80831.1 major facilitator superfamily MFS_1 [Paludibacter propionicigenes WB4]